MTGLHTRTVDVAGVRSDGTRVPILEQGEWVLPVLNPVSD